MKPVAIDPYGCGCTECIIGEYIPLQEATDAQVLDMLDGRLSNHTGYELSDFQIEETWIAKRTPHCIEKELLSIKVYRPPDPGTRPFGMR